MHLPLFGQQTEVLAFDVASIKRAAPDSEDRSMYNFPGRLTVANLVTRSLIESAYGVLPEQILGAPSWVHSERYDIDARCEELQSLSAVEIDRRNMVRLRALLEGRFQLKIHREARVWQTYVLVAGTWAGKLTPTRTTRERYRRTGNRGHTEWEGATMDDLSRHLAVELHRPVTNQTGIEGRFDFVLDFRKSSHACGRRDVAVFVYVIAKSAGTEARVAKRTGRLSVGRPGATAKRQLSAAGGHFRGRLTMKSGLPRSRFVVPWQDFIDDNSNYRLTSRKARPIAGSLQVIKLSVCSEFKANLTA